MPELPEVETTRRGIAPHIVGERISQVIVRDRRLRWPVPRNINKQLTGQTVSRVDRRAKYLLIYTEDACLIMHLGMSGSLRIIKNETPPNKHDHLDIVFESDTILRLRVPRRFGSIHVTTGDPLKHELLRHLGPEPLDNSFDGNYLYLKSRGRKQGVKTFIMDSRNVVGIGNIYACEALFSAGITPRRAAGRISRERYTKLAAAIKAVLNDAIRAGGTTLRDYVSGDGNPGFFELQLRVYGKTGRPCPRCKKPIEQIRQGQRSTFYCPHCQH